MKKIFCLFLLLSSSSFGAVKDGQKFGTWTADCGKGECAVYQIKNTKDGVPIASITIHKPKETKGIPVALFTVPLGVNLLAQLEVRVDNKTITKIPFHSCDKYGCHVAIPLEGKTLQSIRAGKNMQLAIFVNDKQQNLRFSLKGVSKAIDSL